MVHALSTTCRLSVSFVCVATCRYLVPLEGPDGPYLCGGATEVGSLGQYWFLRPGLSLTVKSVCFRNLAKFFQGSQIWSKSQLFMQICLFLLLSFVISKINEFLHFLCL